MITFKHSLSARVAIGCISWSVASVSLGGFTTNAIGTGSTGTTTQDSSTVLPPVDGGIDSSTLSGSLSSALSALSFSSSGGVVTATIGSFGSPAPSSVSYTASPASTCTISGSTVTAVGLGTCSISAVVGKDQYYNAGTVTEDFQVTAVSQTPIALGSISWAVDGTATVPGVTGGDGTGAVTYTASSGCSVSGMTITASAPGTCSVTATKAASGVFDSASVTETVTIAAVSQESLAFDLSGTSFSGTTASLPAPTGGSGSGSVSYSVASGPCTVSGSTVTATGIGSCSVTVTKSGSGLYSDATTSDSISFAGIDPTSLVSFGALPSFSKSSPTQNAPSVTITSGQSYTTSVAPSSVCSISGSSITATGNGNCVMTVNLAASGLYQAATISTGNMTSTAGSYVYSNCSARRGYAVCSSGKHRVPRGQRAQAGCNTIALNLDARCTWSGGCNNNNVYTVINYDDTARLTYFSVQSTWDSYKPGKNYGNLDSYWLTSNTNVYNNNNYMGNYIATMCGDRQ